ncbi:MAG: hypothetical protein QOJ96_3534 [Alphaproteobacteria bacterium]|jgi:hypothetical protein|nr:hypothetical protein [Alphaproteobacteria bacterium]
MTQFRPAWLEHQRRRWMRTDAHLWRHPNASRWRVPNRKLYDGPQPHGHKESPGSYAEGVDLAAEREALLRWKSEFAAVKAEIKFQRLLRTSKAFNPNQPRVPAGNPDGGEWTGGGGTTRVRLAAADKPGLGRSAMVAIAMELAKRAIEAYRSENGLWDLFRRKDGAVTYTNINGSDIFGSNSTSPTYRTIDRAEADGLRARYLEANPDADRAGQMPSNAFYHAETTVLLRAARANGGSLAGQTLEVFGDTRMCNNCEKILPFVGFELGDPTVIFVDPNGKRRRMQNGAWLREVRQ